MSKIWFASDLHLNHDKIRQYCNRPFSNVKEMNDRLIGEINGRIMPNDHFYILGDVCWDDPQYWLGKINCKNIFHIWGNHDKPAGKYERASFVWSKQYHEMKHCFTDQRIRIVLFHYPILDWNTKYHGGLHLYGHIHSINTKPTKENLSYDVGVDNNEFGPISLQEIAEMMNEACGEQKYIVKD